MGDHAYMIIGEHLGGGSDLYTSFTFFDEQPIDFPMKKCQKERKHGSAHIMIIVLQ